MTLATLMHGTSDDNVHIPNSIQLAYDFENAHIPFEDIKDSSADLFAKVKKYYSCNKHQVGLWLREPRQHYETALSML
jgi:hypothetical protein